MEGTPVLGLTTAAAGTPPVTEGTTSVAQARPTGVAITRMPVLVIGTASINSCDAASYGVGVMEMRLLASLALVLLAGCAAPEPFQASAVPGAQAMLSEENDVCFASLRSGQYKAIKPFVECLAVAKIHFTQAIKLRDDTPLKAFVGRLGTLAGETDAGRVDPKEFVERLTAINGEFNDTLASTYRINAEERAEAARRAQAFAAGLAAAGASMQAATPPPNPTLHCTSTRMGAFVNTDCN